MKNSGAIKQIEEELRGCLVKAEEEALHPNTRHLGRLRMELIHQCQKFLELVKHREA